MLKVLVKVFALSIFLAVLALVFSGCAKLEPPAPVSTFRFSSNWKDTTTGRYVFCTNQTSFIRYSFFVRDPSLVASVTEIYIGEATARRLVLPRPVDDLRFDHLSRRLTFTGQLTFGQNMVPQALAASIEPLTVVVAPEFPPLRPGPPAPSDNGGTMVQVQVQTTAGTVHTGRYFFNTFANCPDP
jgi:hypothetical protein